jgi:hypothetical protein
MKTRESDMPDETLWRSFFDPEAILTALKLDNSVCDAVDFGCGHGESCKAGAIHMFFGPGTKITPEIKPDLSKHPDEIESARQLGQKLSHRLKGFSETT